MKRDVVASWISPNVMLVGTNLLEGQTFLLHAIHHARLSRSQLILVHVMSPLSLNTEILDTAPCPALPASVRAVQVKLDEMVEEFRFEGVLCEPIVLVGDPARQLALVAKSRAVDRVFLGARYEPLFARVIEESVAEKVMATIDIPVCIIGRRVLPVPACEAPLGRVLCATSFNAGSLQAVKFAASLAAVNNAHLTLLHVLETGGMSKHEVETARIAARRRLCASVPAEGRIGDHSSYLIRQGDPASIILAEAHSQDLVILGSHRAHMVPRLLRNRVVRRVIEGAQCPVIAINFSPAISCSAEARSAA